MPAVDVALGTGFLSGSFSADGVSDDVLAWLGEEGVCRQVCISVVVLVWLARGGGVGSAGLQVH